MLFNAEVKLIATAPHSVNDIGDDIAGETARSIMADKQSIRQTEFYQAQATGLRPQLMFVVRSVEYQAEAILEHAGQRYRIIRTYERPDEMTELVCSGLAVG